MTEPAELESRALACELDMLGDLSGGRLHSLLTAVKQGSLVPQG